MPATGSGPAPVISASRFVIQVHGINVAFSELSGINSEVEPVEYIASDPTGKIIHTKQFGKTKPPKITLKRALDTDHTIWAWHQLVLNGDTTAPTQCSLQLQDASGKALLTYILDNAWPSKLDISGLKAGSTEVVMETVEIVCDQIMMDSG